MTATTDAPVTPTLEKRLRRAARRQAGMTLLEIMIVLAILALVMGFLVGPRIYRAFQESKEDTQRAIVKKYVYEGFVDWARRNPTKGCPSNIQEVSEQMGRADSKDTWGRELIWFCGDNLPPGAARDGFAVMSLGPDGQQGTKDDIKSWE
ncbi:MAG: prepilin-type N-terminal cleavage/methylation domain-containing protein [Kofleriaceae bacterium]|nr:prepilin-type N-terminal cleavage/methylation domain-containing protein [Myxococcales bacterium]MCB9560957.1 prepilin-type N-terminal cleavage/methylation domain-containing protein [Kofleriaceae bacterium]MCB9574997.1 prepilin-type N-terminal cleavage/methylation domain-containing protein [Kofleriaceae bacterium]